MELFPREIIESTSEYYLSKIRVRSQRIYILIITVLIGIVFCLPYIYIDINIRARGVLEPKSERVAIYSPVPGPVIFNAIYENARLNQGDTIFALDTQLLDAQIEFNQTQLTELAEHLADLGILTSADFIETFDLTELNSNVYQAATIELYQKLERLNRNVRHTQTAYARNIRLYEEEVIALSELEKSTFEFEQAKSSYQIAQKEKKAQWKMDEHQYRHQYNETSAKIDQLIKERGRYFVTAPISGIVQQYDGTRVGSIVYANKKIAEISPDSALIAEMYISTTDIGFVSLGKKVKIQVDAFNYNQWGMLDAEIIQISDDVLVLDETPVFKVKCALHQPFLTLKNGYVGYLKKGMTIGGRIVITRRSLYQLLYDNVDDWLNPAKA